MGAAPDKGCALDLTIPCLSCCSQWVEAVFDAVPAMEPIPSSQQHPADFQLAATIEAWQVACEQGWREPEPECLQVELSLPTTADQGLVGSGWDSWSSNPFLEHQQVEELSGFTGFALSLLCSRSPFLSNTEVVWFFWTAPIVNL